MPTDLTVSRAPCPRECHEGVVVSDANCHGPDAADAEADEAASALSACRREVAQLVEERDRLRKQLQGLLEETERIKAQINSPEVRDFVDGVIRESAHQRERWGSAHDAGKTDADWYWLVGHLAGKALHLPEKRLHHLITAAAALSNWHLHTLGKTDMRPGIAPPPCAKCGGTRKILEDHDGRAGYRPCEACHG